MTVYKCLLIYFVSLHLCITSLCVRTKYIARSDCPKGFFHLFNDTTKACVCFEDNTAYFGNNHRFGAENPQFDRLGCQRSCESHPECNYWTFNKPSEAGEEGLCYLKTKRRNMKYNLTDYVSGSKKCRLPEWQGQILLANICNLYILQHLVLLIIHWVILEDPLLTARKL